MPGTQRRSHSSRRLGDNYQDVVGIKYLIEMVREPGRIRWISFEEDEAGSLDDVVIERDTEREYVQVKYAVEPAQEWSVSDLTRTSGQRGRSLLRKWADSWLAIRGTGQPYRVRVVTNRTPDEQLSRLMTPDMTHLLETLPRSTGSGGTTVTAATGLEVADAEQFFSELEFDFDSPMLDNLETEVRTELSRLGGTENGWNALLTAARRWVLYKEPNDGRIRAGDVRVAARFWDPFGPRLPQQFTGDERVHVINSSAISLTALCVRD